MTRILTYDGMVDLLHPFSTDFTPLGIAYALSHINRHCGNFGLYSVAQHSCLVADIAWRLSQDKEIALAALYHDAGESVINDIPRPLKVLLRQSGCEIVDLVESNILLAVHKMLGLGPEYVNHPTVKEADSIAMKVEARDIVKVDEKVFDTHVEASSDGWPEIHPWGWLTAMNGFLERSKYLTGEAEAQPPCDWCGVQPVQE